MNSRSVHIIFMVLMLITAGVSSVRAQENPVSYSYENGKVIITFKNIPDVKQLDKHLEIVGSSMALTDSLLQLGLKGVTSLGWNLKFMDAKKIVYQKDLQQLHWNDESATHIITIPGLMELPYDLDATFGINKLKQADGVVQKGGVVTFRLFNHIKAKQVFLAGTFNDWSTSGFPLTYRDGAWEGTLKLQPGKHLYKFIVDGYWKTDPNNLLKEKDRDGNVNSVCYVYNHTFKLDIYLNAAKAYVAGSFNGWNDKELRMQKANGRWELPVYLSDGSYSYKFIVDGNWIKDPMNAEARPDGLGNENSFLSKGEPYIFTLNAFNGAKQVVCSGEFNGWNTIEMVMKRGPDGWKGSWVLKPGNYAYKYIVDGQWKLDPDNPHHTGSGDFMNSVVSVKPNYTFELKGYKDAREVFVTGNFNGWIDNGYSMKKTADGWSMSLHLPKGKVLYKFRVDGEWIADPGNPLWEINEYNTRNSILWLP